MAAINIKIEGELKKSGDDVLGELGLNATQYIILCWQYLAQHHRLPFMVDTRIFTAADLTLALATQFDDALNQLHKIRDILQSGNSAFTELSVAKMSLSRQAAEIQQSSWRLETLPEDSHPSAAARRMLPRVNYHLTGCDFALSDLPAELPLPTRVINAFESSL